MPRTTAKRFHCPCLEKLEKDREVTARITVTVILRTKEGWDIKRSVGVGDGLIYCPICGRNLNRDQSSLNKKK